jgi:hypothetical protein
MSASRQMEVKIGDASYQLFSAPVRSFIEVRGDPQPKPADKAVEAGIPPDTWVICGIVPNAEFRRRSLAISSTLLVGLVGLLLAALFSWPFLKMAMISPHNKVTLADVILLGIGAIFITSIVCLAVLDLYTYHALQSTGDDQLKKLSDEVDQRFRTEIKTALEQMSIVESWAAQEIAAGRAMRRNSGMLAGLTLPKPYFQAVSLIDENGSPQFKWAIDSPANPLAPVKGRRYFKAPMTGGRDYIALDGEKVTVDSIRSPSSGQPEIVIARRTTQPALADKWPVIALSSTKAPSVIDPILPDEFGFAIIDESGSVLLHSQSERNTVENFFAETGDEPRLKAAVHARQDETANIRYWGGDYRAHVHPMSGLPWTLIVFRNQRGLRALNTEAVTATMFFLALLFGACLLAFICLVLMMRPGYRAPWLWPDPAHVTRYAELAGTYAVLLLVGVILLLALEKSALLIVPFCFAPLVLVLTYARLRTGLADINRIAVGLAAAILTVWLVTLMWRSLGMKNVPFFLAAILLGGVCLHAVLRRDHETRRSSRRRRMVLPLSYVGAAFLLLLLVSTIPTAAFFKAAYERELDSHVKSMQMQLARDLQDRWWQIAADFNDRRGARKGQYGIARWQDPSDIYVDAIHATSVNLNLGAVSEPAPEQKRDVLPTFVEAILPHYSEASVKSQEMLHDRAADSLWWWTAKGSSIDLVMKNGTPSGAFSISSTVPQLMPSFANVRMTDLIAAATSMTGAVAVVSVLLICAVAFAAARFIARRVFLVDLVHPLWLGQRVLGMRHVLCHPCDDASANRLFRNFRRIDLTKEEDLDLARNAPQSFEKFEPSVFIDGLGYTFSSGAKSELVRDLLDRLTRNGDRTVYVRPTALNVLTTAFLQGADGDAWAKTFSTFVWVNGSELTRRLTCSGEHTPLPQMDNEADPASKPKLTWLRALHAVAGFHAYFETASDAERSIGRTLAAEVAADPYLEMLTMGLGTSVSGRDQLLDEISDRAEDYYSALWHTCMPNEQLVLLQIAQTSLVNGKTRKDVRRLLARGLLRRDPQLRVMNETFRRFVLAQSGTSAVAQQLEESLAGDSWNRFRVPFFAAISAVLLFFFATQRQTFDSTFALVGSLAASLPTFLRTLSSFGERHA